MEDAETGEVSVATHIRRLLDGMGFEAFRPVEGYAIVMPPDVLKRAMEEVPHLVKDPVCSEHRFFGYPIVVDSTVPPNEVYVMRWPPEGQEGMNND